MSFGLDQVFILGESPAEALGIAEQKREASMATGDERGRVLGLVKAAEAFALMGRTDEAQGYSSEALGVCGEMKFEEGRAAAMNSMTKALVAKGGDAEDLEEALDSGMDTLKLSRKIGFRKGEAVALLTLSGVYHAMQNSAQAVKYGKEALTLFAELGEQTGMAVAYEALMGAYLVKSPPEASRAAKQVQKAYAIYESMNDTEKMARCMHTMATVEIKGADYKKASEAFAKSRALYVQAGDIYGHAMVLESLMGLYLQADMYFEAMKVGQDRVSLFHDAGDMSGEGYALVKLGQAYLQYEDHDKAEQVAQKALGTFAAISDIDGMTQAKTLLDDAKQAQSVESIGIALSKVQDFVHIPATLIVDPGLTKRVGEAYMSAMR
mmetsp:Transcript_44649/g.124162  ORF Transcript_44649/g.124162 Transcript_44649/m.124162 type:complete len:380 (-) Transcript_44649:111-1250(-)|eukprot:CAMPEP_0179124804 /NCGR_PEP_ID=MMETSP0796-20121207/58993_1 /TAXON_ID=73915 /ORGANISM="Pyrodinium bahamense, Strain pbaha01" /LENGTH=379 /DNA_ID=CAMNT_0020823475 /DNA_START=91 /DNA_END=1230 /DNA_ORIENTATION=+